MSSDQVRSVTRTACSGRRGRRYVAPVAFAAVVAIALTLSACSSSSSKGAASSSAPAGSASSSANNASCASAPGVTATSVKVGVESDTTGALTSTGTPFEPGAKVAIDQQNAAGGINGRKIVEVDADGASTEAGELAAAQGLIQSNNVFALVSGVNSALATQYEVTNNIPTFNLFAVNPSYATAPNLFSTLGAFEATIGQGPGAVVFAKSLGAQTVAVTAHNSQLSISSSQSVGNEGRVDRAEVGIHELRHPVHLVRRDLSGDRDEGGQPRRCFLGAGVAGCDLDR